MPRVSLESKQMDNTHAGLAGIILVAVLVAFGYWCYYVNEGREHHAYDPDTHNEAKIKQWQETAFQAAIVGFLLIITAKHLRDLLYHM